MIVNDDLRELTGRKAHLTRCGFSRSKCFASYSRIATIRLTASKSLSPASASRQRTSDTPQTAGSIPATCQHSASCAGSCPAHALDSATSHPHSTLRVRYSDLSVTSVTWIMRFSHRVILMARSLDRSIAKSPISSLFPTNHVDARFPSAVRPRQRPSERLSSSPP